MVISKKFDCTVEDLDFVVVELAKEIKDGWHITEIKNYGFSMCSEIKMTEPNFSVTLVRG